MAFPEISEVEIRSTPAEPVEVPIRREAREDTVRIVESAPFPRSDSHRRPRTGFTRDLSKSGIVELGAQLDVPFSITMSCYDPDASRRHCGRCESCRLRRRGFDAAGIPDPTSYAE